MGNDDEHNIKKTTIPLVDIQVKFDNLLVPYIPFRLNVNTLELEFDKAHTFTLTGEMASKTIYCSCCMLCLNCFLH